ncbi:MAG: Na(+)-translocating NADH-quinone reductase subunit A [Paludibacteraceae bacterium]|nr:Na(+)-translocating NADH-quinone reductase subunit A [Paludibacteraceae bacterium]
MIQKIKLKRGLDIAINGKAAEVIGSNPQSEIFSVVPDHFAGITPKVVVKEGERVEAGSPVFYNKQCSEMQFVAPVSGEIIAVNRGERRKVLSIDIRADKEQVYKTFEKINLANASADNLKQALLESGLWWCVKQRPYDVIANPAIAPKKVFVSTFDTAPLAPNYEFVAQGKANYLQAAVKAFSIISGKDVEIGLRAGSTSTEFRMLQHAHFTEFEGAHPAGNVSVQIHHIDAVNKGEVVWTINLQDMLIIGKFLCEGIVDMTKVVALTGPEVHEPQYYRVKYGSTASNILRGNIHKEIALRLVCGNVLSGHQINEDEVLSPYTNQITVLEEGADTHELFGWIMPRFDKFSNSNTFLTKILRKVCPKMTFNFDARILGGQRAMIMSGEYEKVLPMDIYVEYLIKAMIAGNIDKMEALGAYEIAPEDVALCEFVCTSKLPLQAIVRKALDNMKSELE